MKVHWHKFIIAVTICIGIVSASEAQSIGQADALTIAQESIEAVSFAQLFQDNDCINESVIKSCDSDWVTCIDDGWVVEFTIKESCQISHDGRLQLVLVIDKDGIIISRFPETAYFNEEAYCLENYDCLCNSNACMNFIHAPLSSEEFPPECPDCTCIQERCQKR